MIIIIQLSQGSKSRKGEVMNKARKNMHIVLIKLPILLTLSNKSENDER